MSIECLRELSRNSLGDVVAESDRAGWTFVRRLVEEWDSGVNRFDQPGEALFAARVDGQVVGVCGLNVDPYAAQERIGRVRHLYVLSAFRRRGVGRQLVTRVIESARGRFDMLRLRTTNPAAAQFYAALGFRSSGDASQDATHIMELVCARSTTPSTISDTDRVFSGSAPLIYETYLVPLVFEPYAADLIDRLRSRAPSRVLEVAAGTGVVTRALASALDEGTSIVATDLNQAMLDQAALVGTQRSVEWHQADALQLPFADGSFDAVLCQFGAMFFPDKPRAFSEARRVLRPGGVFLFNVWDRIEENDFAAAVTDALSTVFPDDPPRFLARIPHGYHDRAAIERDLATGGFTKPVRMVTVAARSRAVAPRVPAVAYCQGTPLRGEIEARDARRLEEATDITTVALAQRFGSGPVDGRIQAHVITIER